MHVGRLFHKLDLRVRVHVVILAYALGLVRAERGSCRWPSCATTRRTPSATVSTA
jgi:hypothetical protein